MQLVIIQDTKEKLPWNFKIHSDVQQVRRHLETGDYSINGHEHLFCIERKKSTAELALNLGRKIKPFEAELERMAAFKSKHIICEFTSWDMLNFPYNSKVPKKLWKYVKMKGGFLYSKLTELSEKYNINLHYCKSREDAQLLAINIIREYFYNEYI